MKEIKNAVIGVIVLAITTLGGVLINKYIGGEGEEKIETVAPFGLVPIIVNSLTKFSAIYSPIESWFFF